MTEYGVHPKVPVSAALHSNHRQEQEWQNAQASVSDLCLCESPVTYIWSLSLSQLGNIGIPLQLGKAFMLKVDAQNFPLSDMHH